MKQRCETGCFLERVRMKKPLVSNALLILGILMLFYFVMLEVQGSPLRPADSGLLGVFYRLHRSAGSGGFAFAVGSSFSEVNPQKYR